MCVYASQSYLDRHLPHADTDGEGPHWIGWGKAERDPDWVKDTPFPAASVRRATTDHVLQLSLARRGFGMINTSVYFVHLYPELVVVPGSEPKPDKPLWILLHSELRRTTCVRRFVDFLARELEGIRPLLRLGTG